jgi:two-component system sensor histidine kinase PilS (NtrC family)
VNLLDNALRHAQPRNTTVFLQTTTIKFRRPSLIVWNEGPPLEKTMLQHLFEPFFSSESRSSGLGLYICRELCDRHQAFISYRRASRPLPDPMETMGNEFRVSFRVNGERRQNP